MYTLETRNVNTAYFDLLRLVECEGMTVDTRNGKAMMLPQPLLLEIRRPTERVLFDSARNANPFFHCMEGLWMLAGRKDVAFVAQFNQNMKTYSDDGLTYNAAYGYRWRKHFGYDQIARACDMLVQDPSTRRCVIAMWDGAVDLAADSKDIPCNTTITCRIERGALDFVITNRSNDLIFGLCGANAVHMSMLQEYMAHRIGVAIGKWWHLTVNLHVYEMHYHLLSVTDGWTNWTKYPASMPLVNSYAQFDRDCAYLCEGAADGFAEPFIAHVAAPMVRTWRAWKENDFTGAIREAGQILADDWRQACNEWLIRAKESRDAKA